MSEPLRTAQGFVFITVTGKQPSTLPVLDAVKERVRNDIIQKKAVDAAKAAANWPGADAEVGGELRGGGEDGGTRAEDDRADLARRRHPRRGREPGGRQGRVLARLRRVSDPIVTDTGAVIVKVVERTDVKPAELTTAKDGLKREMIAERQNRFFSSYMTKAKEKLRIETYPQTISRVLG